MAAKEKQRVESKEYLKKEQQCIAQEKRTRERKCAAAMKHILRNQQMRRNEKPPTTI